MIAVTMGHRRGFGFRSRGNLPLHLLSLPEVQPRPIILCILYPSTPFTTNTARSVWPFDDISFSCRMDKKTHTHIHTQTSCLYVVTVVLCFHPSGYMAKICCTPRTFDDNNNNNNSIVIIFPFSDNRNKYQTPSPAHHANPSSINNLTHPRSPPPPPGITVSLQHVYTSLPIHRP